jgi:hypothetical protein
MVDRGRTLDSMHASTGQRSHSLIRIGPTLRKKEGRQNVQGVKPDELNSVSVSGRMEYATECFGVGLGVGVGALTLSLTLSGPTQATLLRLSFLPEAVFRGGRMPSSGPVPQMPNANVGSDM